MAPTEHLWALVLAGGDGNLETTLARIAPLVPQERTLAIVNRGHLPLARPQLAAIPASNVLVQPRNLDTGPGLLVSLLALARRDAAATVAVFPSDHDFRNEAAFRRHVARMALLVAAHPERIALLGARPDRAESGYGYMRPGVRSSAPARPSASSPSTRSRLRPRRRGSWGAGGSGTRS